MMSPWAMTLKEWFVLDLGPLLYFKSSLAIRKDYHILHLTTLVKLFWQKNNETAIYYFSFEKSGPSVTKQFSKLLLFISLLLLLGYETYVWDIHFLHQRMTKALRWFDYYFPLLYSRFICEETFSRLKLSN